MHAHARQHTRTHAHKTKCAILDLALWTYGAVCIDLLVWVAMQCNNRYVCRMTSLSLKWATLHTLTQGPGYKYSSHETTSTCTDHMNTGAHTVMAGICKH